MGDYSALPGNAKPLGLRFGHSYMMSDQPCEHPKEDPLNIATPFMRHLIMNRPYNTRPQNEQPQ